MKNIIFLIVSILVFSLLSCNNKQDSKSLEYNYLTLQTNYSPKSLNVNENMYDSFESVEFPFEYSIFEFNKPNTNVDVKIKVVDTFENYISWNIDGKNYSYNKSLSYVPSRDCVLEWYNKNRICFFNGCGTNCYYYWILSCENNKTNIKYYYNAILIDTVKHLIFYDLENEKGSQKIENYITGKGLEVFPSNCDFSNPLERLQKAEIENNKLYIEWEYNKDCICNNKQVIELPKYLF